MSDYLWDKTGEAEEDVEQLENLLGALRYQPRPLEIPATAMPNVMRPRTTLIFSRTRLAVAASLLLTLLAGMWFVTRQGEPQTVKLVTVNNGGERVGSKQTATAVVPNIATGDNAPFDKAVEPKPRENRSVFVATATPKIHRAPRGFVAKRQKLQPRLEENTTAQREEVAINNGTMLLQVEQPMTPEQREATEKLMLALRLASAKLNYAQREMQEIGRAGK
jgi:hypothetical protein